MSTSNPAVLVSTLRRRREARAAVVVLTGDPGTQLYLIEAGGVTIALTSPVGKGSS